MKAIRARNVNDAFPVGIKMLEGFGVQVHSQHGVTLEIPEAASIMYDRPCERVLFDPIRDSNPFLGFFESLWIIAGRNDVKFLESIVGTMNRYSDDGLVYYGAYGRRMRTGMVGINLPGDQIEEAILRLRANPDDRQVVLAIRDRRDMWYRGKDNPCNLMVDCKIRSGKLNIQVFNRSNDFVWGMLGTNAVQFSTLQEYLAGMIGCEVGHYHQTTSSMHVYVNDQWDKIRKSPLYYTDPYSTGSIKPFPMMDCDVYHWGMDLNDFFSIFADGFSRLHNGYFRTPYFRDVVVPMWTTLWLWKEYQKARTDANAERMLHSTVHIAATDWQRAVIEWISRRITK